MFLCNHADEHEILHMFLSMLSDKDTYTAEHSKRVAQYALSLAKHLGLSEQEQIKAYHSGLLHDIGKLLMPESILLKPRKLTSREYSIIKSHSEHGEKMLSFLSHYQEYMPILRHHHEHYDGRGYPDGLMKEDIPLLSRILCVADAFDAMTTNRIYQPAKSFSEALLELEQLSGKQFDPSIVRVALQCLSSFATCNTQNPFPQNTIEEDRFAFYFKDKVTMAYSSEYLNYFLLQQQSETKFTWCYLIELHALNKYNKMFGWQAGNTLLEEIVLRLKSLFPHTMIFRIFGDDFVILSHERTQTCTESIKETLCRGFFPVYPSIKSFLLEEFTFNSWEDFEPYLQSYNQQREA